MKELVELYIAFLRIGCVAFGGGYALLPILEKDLVNTRHWTTMDELTDYFAIGQCTPGVIAVNVSTFIGKKRSGIPGAIATLLGFLTAPVILIILIAAFLSNFAHLPVVQHAFAGIRVCVLILILQAVLKLWKKSIVDRTTLGLYLVIFVLTAFSSLLPFSVPVAALVIAAGIFGLFFGKDGNEKKKGGAA
ncbi:MAG: chromate transporter [Lachnospiraceae bacterium]|nr:chromate transporter [Lachnospiraceae bacterium]